MPSSKLSNGRSSAPSNSGSAKHASPYARTLTECVGRASPLLEECVQAAPVRRAVARVTANETRSKSTVVVTLAIASSRNRMRPHVRFGERGASPVLSAPDLRRIHAMRTQYPHERGVRTPLASIRLEKLQAEF